jgi:fructokinase
MPARPTIVAIGEVLWDMFPDGAQFGGAPANFACTAAELSNGSMDVHIVSAVGRDELGTRAFEILRQHGVSTDFVSKSNRTSGQVLVHVSPSGDASYEFASDTAWDNIVWMDELTQLAARADVVCFGTLGQRSEVSRQTIHRFLGSVRRECFCIFDINLRPPFWTDEIVRQSLKLANVLKLNDSEIRTVAQMFEWRLSDREVLQRLINEYSLQLAALTKGTDGVTILDASGDVSEAPAPRVKVANTVGAGDAFTAALGIGLLQRMPLDGVNAWANQVAAYVCTQPGASPAIPASLRPSNQPPDG